MTHKLETPRIWYPNQRVIRTVFTAVVGLVPVVAIVLGILADQWPAEWLVAAAGASLSVQAVLTKVMANETVNAWLIRYTFLGSQPN
ncbi:hypothetical protein HQQ81_05595 [Microbacteriaceae bacterium VKM Ac-2854]|nr:hypothetical protein [Microbacteriaceae bacterium VKM Ac-2854]